MWALRTAALRGVEVRLIVPLRNNHVYAGLAGRALYEDLLCAGVRIFERRPPFIHAKTLVVDDAFALVGTANLDARNPVVTLIAKVEGPRQPDTQAAPLVPGLFVRAKIRGRQGVQTTPIPRSALQVDGTILSVDASDKLRRLPVRVLMLTGTEALLAEPVEGDRPLRVITRAPSIVIEGMDVQVTPAAGAASNR